MADNWLEAEALKFEGFSDAQIAQLKAAWPKGQQLLALIQKNRVDIDEAVVLIDALIPTVSMAMQVLKARMT